MASRPLVVAVAAGVALVGLLAVDLAIDRTLALDVRDGEGWRTLSSTSSGRPRYAEPMAGVVKAPENGSVEFRLRVDNGYPTAASDDYVVTVYGRIVEEGRVDVPARENGEVVFTITTRDLLGGSPLPAKPTGGELTYASMDVQTLGRAITASFQMEVTS